MVRKHPNRQPVHDVRQGSAPATCRVLERAVARADSGRPRARRAARSTHVRVRDQALVAVYSKACPTTAVAPALPRDAGVFADAPLTVGRVAGGSCTPR